MGGSVSTPRLSFGFVHEAWYAEPGTSPGMYLLGRQPDGGLDWELTVDEGHALSLKISEASWSAFTQVPWLFEALAQFGEEGDGGDDRLEQLSRVLKALGFVDITPREETPGALRPVAWSANELGQLADELNRRF